jgi:hypothetical protein
MSKRVKTDADLNHFLQSSGYKLLVLYLEKLCLLVKGDLGTLSSGKSFPYPDDVQKCVSLLENIEAKANEIEPIDQPMRFGNKAFRSLHSWLEVNIDSLLIPFGVDVADELRMYILDSFGNPTRIDYGTGHEAAFFMFIVVLLEYGKLKLSSDIIHVIFRKYINVVRLITGKYNMEPAGSHGVWGLDDYHHLPFLFGAAQLIGHEGVISPGNMLQKCQDSSLSTALYADMIKFIKNTKCKYARFHEVAPLLSDLSRMDNWSKVCMGLMRMYTSEVLGKRPIAQHFYFGNVIRWTEN